MITESKYTDEITKKVAHRNSVRGGRVTFVTYTNKEDQLHREDGPAAIQYSPGKDGTVITKFSYYINGNQIEEDSLLCKLIQRKQFGKSKIISTN